MRRYQDKVVAVTGGASGLGEAFCHRFAQEGARVAVLDLDPANGERVVKDIIGKGGQARHVFADVTSAASMEDAVAQVLSAYGRLDTAVNNAGIGGGMHPITEFPVDAWVAAINVNLVGVFLSMRAEIPALLQGGGGSIINVASIMGAVAAPFTSAYVASKHGVVGLTKSAALEWSAKNIRVNAVGPTWVRTPLTTPVFQTDDDWDRVGKDHPIGRAATPEDIAAVVAFLGSDDAAIVTGALYLADGGYTTR